MAKAAELRSEQARNGTLKAKITALETERSIPARKRPRSVAKSLALLLVGVLLGLVFSALLAR